MTFYYECSDYIVVMMIPLEVKSLAVERSILNIYGDF